MCVCGSVQRLKQSILAQGTLKKMIFAAEGCGHVRNAQALLMSATEAPACTLPGKWWWFELSKFCAQIVKAEFARCTHTGKPLVKRSDLLIQFFCLESGEGIRHHQVKYVLLCFVENRSQCV